MRNCRSTSVSVFKLRVSVRLPLGRGDDLGAPGLGVGMDLGRGRFDRCLLRVKVEP